jgi:urease gamma subunit
MNYYQRPTPLHEQANAEAIQHFAEHIKQFKANCDALHSIEGNPSVTASDASRAALQSSGRIIQTDDGTQWQHAADLTGITSVCHRRTAAGLEFAIVECLPLKSGEIRDVLNSGHDVREVLQEFARDQRQVLNLWKEDVIAQVREHLDEKYPHQDMGIVVESFEIKMARDIARRETLAQNHSHGVRV